MLKRIGPLAALCVALSGTAAQDGVAAARNPPPLTRQAIRYGLQLQVSIPRLTYPRDALVRVTIRLTNRSTRVIDVTGNDAPMCESGNGLGIEVQTKTGHLVFPPAAPWVMASCGRRIFPISLPPGATLVDHPLIVLRGAQVRGVITIGKVGDRTRSLKTPAFHLQLTPRDVPPVTFSATGGPHLVIGPVPWRHTALYYVESGVCLHPGDGGVGSGIATWQRLSPSADGTYDFGMPCDGEARWAFAGGMLNHSVVREVLYM